jgi:hypothetical protein
MAGDYHASDATGRSHSLGAALMVCSFFAWGCGGTTATNGPVDAASGADGSNGSSVDASMGVSDGGSSPDAGQPASSSGDAATNADAASCSPVLASDYDQSCAVDTDCVEVSEVAECPAAACDSCGGSAISKSVMVQYMAAFEQAFASKTPGTFCGCGGGQGPCCRSGKCTATCVSSTDPLPACANAGGTCLLSHGATCGTNGPPDSCAYPDEICCL